VSSLRDGILGVWRLESASTSWSSSSWITLSDWKFVGRKLRVETSDPRFLCRRGANCGDIGSTLEPGEVGREESSSNPLSNSVLFRYIEVGELGTDEGAKSDNCPD